MTAGRSGGDAVLIATADRLNLGYQVIAEVVETLIQAEWLTAQGCDELQGFYYARPSPAGENALHPPVGK